MSENKNDQMGLSECAASDHEKKLRDVHTLWRKVSDDRRARGVSRKERRKGKRDASTND